MAENRLTEGIAQLKTGCEALQGGYAICSAAPGVGEADDRAGHLDSALAIYERYLRQEATRRACSRASYVDGLGFQIDCEAPLRAQPACGAV